MSIENDFDPMIYAQRIMQSKGYDPAVNDELADIFELQWPFWQDLFNRHRLGDDLSRAEQILTRFAQRETFGGATKVLEAFTKHLEAQPKQGGSPDWSAAGKEWRECAYCDGRGVISDIPVKVERRGEVLDRVYSFACICDRGRFFAGMKVAEDWMVRFAADRKQAEIAGHREKLAEFGIDPDADAATRAKQFRAAFVRMKQQIASRKATAKTVRANPSGVMQAANSALGAVRPPKRKPSPPPQLNPEALALAAYDNGDDRNEWE